MLRLIDANLDRLGEGVRVLEDIARFVLDDSKMSGQLKNVRHDLVKVSPELKNRLLASRDSVADVGRERVPVSGSPRNDVVALVTANAKRAQESLRVLEESVKLPDMPPELKSKGFEKARFTLYTIEKEMTLKLAERTQNEQD